MAVRSFPGDFLIEPSANRPYQKCHYCKALAFAAGLGLSMLSYPGHAVPNNGDAVQRLCDALLSTMKNGRQLRQSGRYTQLEPVIRRSFDIASMARLAVGPSWAGLTETQHQHVTDCVGRYMSAIYADCFCDFT